MLAILDYGIGNIRSVANAVHYLGMDATVTNNADEIAASDGLILPGVGAFGAGMQRIADHGLRPLIDGYAASGKPLLGICLGFQLLMRSSDELGDVAGLGYIDADIRRLKVNAKIPHIGWNTVATPNGCTEPSDLMQGL
ncbi:MAG: imidazole glycerol phosphate synthase subunit HisH, partial [Rhodobacteraceae bacterium]|nr:imidazole glycerol phosphate synthase subunit HisH [Paracoccaceae bacterium]